MQFSMYYQMPIGVGIVLSVILFAVLIASYLLNALALFCIARRRGLPAPGLAWVPVASAWLLGSIADQFDRKAKGRDKKLRLMLLLGYIVTILLTLAMVTVSGIAFGKTSFSTGELASMSAAEQMLILIPSILLSGVAITTAVFELIALYKAYRSCAPRAAIPMLVLSILLGDLVPSICLFCIRKRDGGFLMLERKQREYEEQQLNNIAE